MDRVPVAEITSHGKFKHDGAVWFSRGSTVTKESLTDNIQTLKPKWLVKAQVLIGNEEHPVDEIAFFEIGLLVEPVNSLERVRF
jgi:hypothetical protein